MPSTKFCAVPFYLPTWSKEKYRSIMFDGKGEGQNYVMTENSDFFVDTDRILSYLSKRGHRLTSTEVTPIGPPKGSSGALLSVMKVTAQKKQTSKSSNHFALSSKGKSVTRVVNESREKISASTSADPMDCDASDCDV